MNPTTSTELQSPLTQAEKRREMENDRKVREQGTSFKSFEEAFVNDRGGRFTKVESPPKPLPPNSPWSGEQPQPGEEASLGYSVDRVER
jgi:hypothetical protein